MAQLVTELNDANPNQWLLANLLPEVQACITHDRIFWFEELDPANFKLTKFPGLHKNEKGHQFDPLSLAWVD